MALNLVSESKFLSLILRHKPETIGLTLDDNGWADLGELIEKAKIHHHFLSPEIIGEIVASSDKQRFAISADGLKIRANQGHSLKVDLHLTAQSPPDVLYHGTATRFLASILAIGVKPQSRQYVHLSKNAETAREVGQRHGKAIVLEVAAKQMAVDGYSFFLSENRVWLVEQVPPCYLSLNDS
jgi:putative RNA 2'-phosphotransferase